MALASVAAVRPEGGGLADFVALHARARPDHPALITASDGAAINYAELDRLTSAAGAWLAANGVCQGARIAAISRNRPELVVLHLACARIGAIFAPLNWRLSAAELSAILEDCDPALLFAEIVPEGLRLPPGCATIGIDQVLEAIAASNPLPSGSLPGADLASLMLYTSGTSARPKGVLLSEANLLATARNFTVLGQVTPSSRFLADTPMFHIIGMVTNFRPAFMMGATVMVSPGFVPETTLLRLADPGLGLTHYFCVPQMARMLRESPGFDAVALRRLTAIFTGGAPHPPAWIREWLDEGVTIADGYGMTETGTVFGMPLVRSIIARKAGSAGLLPPTIEHRIVRPDESSCSTGEVGELLLRGPNLTLGYWRLPEETRQAFTRDGFFRTGDLVRRDEDGFFFVVDRKKDMFISGGENVYPTEIEAVLKAHPDIADACVVAVADRRWGEVGHAAVILRDGATFDESALMEHCARLLGRYKLPKAIVPVPDLPRTASGKVIKARLYELLVK